MPEFLADRDNAVHVRVGGRNFLDGDDVAGMGLVCLDALLDAAPAARARQRDHVGQHDGEGLVADDVARAPDRVAQTERRLLAGEAGVAGAGRIGEQGLQFLGFAATLQRILKLVGVVEMILDYRLVPARHEHEMLDARLAGFLDAMLEHGSIDNREHLLGNDLGGGKHARAEARHGENCLADTFCHEPVQLE